MASLARFARLLPRSTPLCAGRARLPLQRSPNAALRSRGTQRHASTGPTASAGSASSTPPPPPPPPLQARTGAGTALTTVAILSVAAGVYLVATDTRASAVHRHLVPALLRAFVPDAEDAHHLGTAALKTLHELGLHPRERSGVDADGSLSVSVFGRTLANPIGISAGLDKNAEIPDALFAVGPAVVEVGGVTPRPQPGNPRPRVFRVPSIQGMVNRYGLNSAGADAVARTLRTRLRRAARGLGLAEADVLAGESASGVPVGSLLPGRLLCVQVAKAKETDEKDVAAVTRDYTDCVRRLAPYADVVVVNVSSPNTPGLRDLQAAGPLSSILSAVVAEARSAAAACGRPSTGPDRPRVMVKVSPDEDSPEQVNGVVGAVWSSGVDGVIVGNTTKRRDVVPVGVPLTSREVEALAETGGYSGPALFDRTVALVGKYRDALDRYPAGRKKEEVAAQAGAASLVPPPAVLTRPRTGEHEAEPKVIFATGGITTGSQALQVLNAGASVAMVYTGMVYGGPGIVTRMKEEMKGLLKDS
ncbi:hypothetical protein GGTG_09094 [Gaeumannomyces tritici R3-111a-1]|uniref:Dihydroorotate dehydrogenase (quinone), mitochondrial n=1 Tax=Gaeumannomyces tritici (strain R3-111a-1) TaxID=644352 RepID=J3P6F4_GAET3|nr:hypothetical protein GGTG_09094 [Gaeumannomyces tritici R3-111a-1]EJT72228.1 hypothetical protein GGTG_09094 [Gaeumannomyces tritici R3-111a-1]